MLRYQKLTEDNYRKNRTIVSRDIESILRDIEKTMGLDLILHKYKTGSDIGTWIIPPAWDVNEAWVKNSSGETIASYEMHPLFLVPYSKAFFGNVSLDELKRHTHIHPHRPNDYYYQHRFAYDYRLRLSDWAISLPQKLLNDLPPDDYQVHIDVDVTNGEMLVGEFVLPGHSKESIALLCDYCHPGQVNDSWSGILAMIDVMKKLSRLNHRRYTYRFYLFPETIGSCVLLSDKPDIIETTALAIFSEFVGWGANWKILASGDAESEIRKLATIATSAYPEFEVTDLFSGYGNDEIVFDYAHVPACSVQMSTCEEYHSSADSPELLEQENIDKASDVIFNICSAKESNKQYRFKHKTPIYLTRYDIYSDAALDTQKFTWNRHIIHGIRDGKTIVDIAIMNKINYEYVVDYVKRLYEHNLLTEIWNT